MNLLIKLIKYHEILLFNLLHSILEIGTTAILKQLAEHLPNLRNDLRLLLRMSKNILHHLEKPETIHEQRSV